LVPERPFVTREKGGLEGEQREKGGGGEGGLVASHRTRSVRSERGRGCEKRGLNSKGVEG